MLHRLIGALLLTLILAACGGDDDGDEGDSRDATTQPAAMATARSADAPTATVVRQRATTPAGATEATVQSTTEAATATSADQTSATELSAIDPEEAERRLFDMLLTVDDLGADFTELNRDSQMDEGTSEQVGLCNIPPFEQFESRIANVEADWNDAGPTRYVVQNIILFPDAVVPDAVEHVRSTLACTEFTDEEIPGESTDYTLTPIDAAALNDLGDDALGASVVAAGKPEVVHVIYVRVGMVLTGLSYVDATGASDPAASLPAALELAERAAARIEARQ
jgi:hypothetical protein